jgi:hypothetical protein
MELRTQKEYIVALYPYATVTLIIVTSLSLF